MHSKHVCVQSLYAGSHHAASQSCAQPRPRNLVNVSLAASSHLSIGQVPCRLQGGAQCRCRLPKFVVSRIAQGPLPVSHPIRHHNITHCSEVRYCKLLVRRAQVCVSSGLFIRRMAAKNYGAKLTTTTPSSATQAPRHSCCSQWAHFWTYVPTVSATD